MSSYEGERNHRKYMIRLSKKKIMEAIKSIQHLIIIV